MVEVDFATDFAGDVFFEANGDGVDGFDVGGDVFALDAVASGDATDEEAVFIGEA